MGLSPLILDTSADYKSKRPGEPIFAGHKSSQSLGADNTWQLCNMQGRSSRRGVRRKKYPPTAPPKRKKLATCAWLTSGGPAGKCHRCHRHFTVTAVRFRCSTTSQKCEWKDFCRVKEWKKTLRTLRRVDGRASGRVPGKWRDRREDPSCLRLRQICRSPLVRWTAAEGII